MSDDDNTEETEATSLLVRSTMHLPDIGMDAVVYVDPRVPYVAGCLARGFLVPVEAESAASEGPPETADAAQLEAAAPAPQQEQSSDEVDPGLEDAAAVEPD